MKRIVALLAFVGISVLVSCDKDHELRSLAGTKWKTAEEGDNFVFELEFGASQFTYTAYGIDNEPIVFPGTYTYDYPEVIVQTESGIRVLEGPGVINGDTLTIVVIMGDIGGQFEFKRQK